MKAYLHSVKGTLREAECHFIEVDRRFWPMQVQSLMLTQHKLTMNDTDTTSKTATPMEIDTEDQQIACENLLDERLQKMKRQIEYYEKELDEKQSTFIRFTSTIQETIEIHVQTYGIKLLKMKRDLKLALVNYDYDSKMLQREYFQEQPNNYQIEVAKCLSTAKVEVEKSKRTLLELKYRVFYNKPPDSFDSSGTLMPTLNHDDQRLFDKHEKAIQRKKLDLMTVKIAEAETKFYHSLKRFDHELATMWKNHRDLVKNQGMTTTLTNLIENRLKNITDRWRDIYNYRFNNYIRNSYDNLDSINTKEIDQKSSNSGFSSFLIIDAIDQFSEKQLQLLNRGPTYVPPCQTSILSSCHSMYDIVERKYAPLKHQLNSLFSKHHINVTLSLEIQQKISDQFADSFSVPIPSNLRQRALYEDRLILSIRYSLKKKIISFFEELLTISIRSIWEIAKSLKQKHKGYGGQQWQTELNQMVESMNLLLESLKNHESLNLDLYNGLLVDANQIYTLTKGSPNTMPLSDTLSNIYVFVWQKQILKQLQLNNEFFGRYKDQIFFTWNNGNQEQLGSFLQTIRDKSPNVQFQKLIASSVPFLNAFVQNQNGNLFSRIYRRPLIQGYSLPYEVSHAKLVHIEDFNLERIFLELTCLTNGYSLRFVETHVQHFFNFFHLHPMRYSRDQIMYNKFRHNWFNYIKIQHELSVQLQQFDDKGQLIHLNYLYEYGARCKFNEQFHRIWSEYFNQHPNLSIPKCEILLNAINVFTSINNYEIYLINQSTSPMLLHNSSELASKTTEFTIDTKHHYYTTTINSVIGSNRTFTASVHDAILVDKIAVNGNFPFNQYSIFMF
ncbi:unnamed protein product [Rotaria magnacalcarata]|uniref:Uncharacterized protein n=1 Tax=Rotaria magnacalcarata TaxID=392030 RepID=A0A8S2PWY7_9BILA|nr:unnamed protein product [Rotaria magnacalcarata]